MTTIRTGRLTLRTARHDDLDAIHAVLSHPEAMRWWSTTPHEDIEQSRVWLEGMIANTAAGAADFVVEYSGRVVGKAGCWKAPDVGYILHPDVWGQGLASEALGAVIDHVFATTDLDALTADVDPNNAASIKLLERLGFVRTGEAKATWHIGGQWMDSLYYGLQRSRWQMRREG